MVDVEQRRIICKVCLTQFARYICPRCNTTYCSLPCYKQHSETCTEAFYRDQAVQQLKGTHVQQAARRELLAVLQRHQEEREHDTAVLEQMTQLAAAGGGDLLLGEGEDEEAGSSSSVQTSESESGSDSHEEEDATAAADAGARPAERSEASSSGADHNETAAPSRGSAREGAGPGRRRAAGAAAPSSSAPGVLSRKTLAKLARQLKRAADLGDVDVERHLTPAELAAFQRALASGQLSHLLTPWQPWWLTPEAREAALSASGQPLVSEVPASSSGGGGDGVKESRGQRAQAEGEGAAGGAGASLRVLPPGPEQPLQPLAALTRARPSPLLPYQLVEVLYAYCFAMRRYNGEAASAELVHEAVALLGCLTPALAPPPPPAVPSQGSAAQPQAAASGAAPASPAAPSQGQAAAVADVPASVSDAIMRCLSAACAPPVGDATLRLMALGILSDVAAVLAGGQACVILALADLRRLFQRAGTGAGGPSRSRTSKKQLLALASKVWFLACWAREQDEAALSGDLAGRVEGEHALLAAQQLGGGGPLCF